MYFAVKLTESKNDYLTIYARNNVSPGSLLRGDAKSYGYVGNRSIIDFGDAVSTVGGLMEMIQVGSHENLDWTILTQEGEGPK